VQEPVRKETNLRPIKRARLYEGAVEQIKKLILENQYKPGDRLPSERELAEQLGIGRPAMREALKILNMIGLVEIRVGDGTYVKDISFSPYIESIVASISSRLKMEQGNFLWLFEVRKILEMEIARLACDRITPEIRERVKECLLEMEANLENREAFAAWGVRFHREIAEATGNEILILIWDSVWDLLLRSEYKVYRNAIHSPEISLQGHRKIYQALVDDNPMEAWKAMEIHLEEEHDVFLSFLTTLAAVPKTNADGGNNLL
jgi:GntR family transcriptional repressor for pyruvate dehydrogenase complex